MSAISSCSWAPKLARKCGIKHWLQCGADGRLLGCSVYGHVITKFSRRGRLFTEVEVASSDILPSREAAR